MFDGVPDQFHQFITSRTSLPLHLPFPLHVSSATTPNSTFPTFDPYNHHSHHQLPLQPNLLHSLHHHKNEETEENNTTVSMNFEIQRDQRQQLPQLIDPWTNEEVLALLRIRSSMESWFPGFTWEHVSRKLAEVGYKRSAEKCKEKFEEESRYFNNININNNNNYGKNNNYRFLSELEELYQVDNNNSNQNPEKTTPSEGQDKNITNMGHALEEDSRNDDASVTKKNDDASVVEEKNSNKDKKRKRGDNRFEVFKGFCESFVQKMMEQQEEMHNKLIEDMVRRDEEKFTREEAWKKEEMEKMNKELEMMASEQAIAGDRQASIIEFLNKFSPTSLSAKLKVAHCSNPDTSSPLHSQNPNPNPNPSAPEIQICLHPTPSSAMIQNHLNNSAENPSSSVPSSTSALAPKNNPSSNSLNSGQNDPLETNSSVLSKDDIGRRWPKDEVLALINLRCTSVNNNNCSSEENKEGNKAPLWERISQGMLELGYKRSAKRCKEKWENINKYFRKTKDANRKRSLDSRTCPYFHLLSNLYKQGKLVLQSERSESHLNAPDQAPVPDQTQAQAESSQMGPAGNFTMQQQVHHGGEKTVFQVPSLDFDQF